MKLLLSYLKNYKWLGIFALSLAAINQCFSLLDPLIAGKMLDRFGVHIGDYKGEPFQKFFNDILLLLLASMGVAMVSRIAKNFQDYFTNVITQRLGARIYSDGVRHSLELPYATFEDQRSGETLGKLQKVRSDVERLINAAVNILFISLIGVIFSQRRRDSRRIAVNRSRASLTLISSISMPYIDAKAERARNSHSATLSSPA